MGTGEDKKILRNTKANVIITVFSSSFHMCVSWLQIYLQKKYFNFIVFRIYLCLLLQNLHTRFKRMVQ